MEAECSFSAIVKQQAVAGGDKPEEKNAVQLLISMNSKQRQEERWRRERKSYVTRRCPSSLKGVHQRTVHNLNNGSRM